MLWQKLIGATPKTKSGVFLSDVRAVTGSGSVTLNIGDYQANRVLVFGLFVNTATNGVPNDLQVNGAAITKTGTNTSGTVGYLFGLSTSTTGSTCTFQPTASVAIFSYYVVVWSVYGGLSGSFTQTAQSETTSATTRTASVTQAGSILFAIAGGSSQMTLNMGTNGVVDWSATVVGTSQFGNLSFFPGHREPSSTAAVTSSQPSAGPMVVYLASVS